MLAVAAAAATFGVIHTKARESGHLKRNFSRPQVASAQVSRGSRQSEQVASAQVSRGSRQSEQVAKQVASAKNNAPRVPFDTRRVPLFGLMRFPAPESYPVPSMVREAHHPRPSEKSHVQASPNVSL